MIKNLDKFHKKVKQLTGDAWCPYPSQLFIDTILLCDSNRNNICIELIDERRKYLFHTFLKSEPQLEKLQSLLKELEENQKARIATKEDVEGEWSSRKHKGIRCYLCGYKLKVGDVWRWVYAGHKGLINFMTCEKCDGDDILERWIRKNEIAKKEFWWLTY